MLSRNHDFQVFLSPSAELPHCTNPPAFNWPQDVPESRYTFELVRLATGEVQTRHAVSSPVLFETLLTAGEYQWRVIDAMGESSSWIGFAITGEEAEYLPPSPEQLFKACEDREQFLLYMEEDLVRIREASAEDLPRLRATAQVALANSLPQYPDHYRYGRESYKRLAIHQIREWVDRDLMSLALLYRIEDDKDLGQAAVERLLKLAEWSTDGPATLVRPCQWGDEVGLSLARNVFLAYHWLRPLLAEGERCFVRSMLIRVAQQMRLRLEQDSFTQMPGHSHTSRLPAYLGIAALVLHKEHDEAQCRKWLQYALDIHQGVLPFHGNADGGWAEGAFYSSSYTKWFHPFFLAVERLSGFSFYQHPFYRNYLAYCRDFVANDNDLHPFGDGFWCHPDGKEWPGFFAQNPLRIYAQRFGSMDDIQKSRQREEVIEIYSLHLLDVIPTRDQVRISQERFSQQWQHDSQTHGDSRHVFYSHAGHGLDRFDALELRYRCSPFGNSSHRHGDQGNVSFIDAGRSVLCPTGSYGYAFGSQHHREWTRTSLAHNVPLIDGVGQCLDDPRATARRISSLHTDVAVTHRLDLSAAYTGDIRYTRTLVFLKGAGIVIIDDLASTSPFEVQWQLHSAWQAALQADEQGQAVMLCEDQRDYRLRLDSHPQLTPVITHGYAEEREEHIIIYSDANPDVTHMIWQIPAQRQHHILASCVSQEIRVVQEGERLRIAWAGREVVVDAMF